MNTTATSSYPPVDYSHISPLPPLDHRRLIMSTWHALEQPPPPSLREILGAYRSKGDGDRDMLIAMLNAKSAEDQRMASVASLHRTLLELYTTETKTSITAPSQQYPLSSPHMNSTKKKRHSTELLNGHEPHTSAPSPRDPPQQLQPPRKRQRSSRSPTQSSHHDARSSHTSSRDLPPSPYSSRSDSEEYSPRSRASMAIGSLLSSAGRDSAPDDSQNVSDVPQNRFPPSAIGVSI